MVMLREDESFPARALIPLTIGHEAEDAAWLALELLAQREPGRQGKPVPETAGAKQDILNPHRRGMTAIMRAVFVKLRQVLVAKPTHCPERDIICPRRVPFRKHELVGRPHNVMVQDQHHVEAGKITSDMADAALEMHLQETQPGPAAKVHPCSGPGVELGDHRQIAPLWL